MKGMLLWCLQPPSWMSTVSWLRDSAGQLHRVWDCGDQFSARRLAVKAGKETQEKRLGEHISEAQKTIRYLAPDHTAFEPEELNQKLCFPFPPQIHTRTRNQGKPKKHFEAAEATGAGPSGCSKGSRVGYRRWMFSFRPDPSDQRELGPPHIS